jgi:hypothetical protein
MQLHRQANKLGRQSFNLRNMPEHAIQAQHKEATKRYERTLKYTKEQHWRGWLKRAEEPDIWMANHYVSAPATDSGKGRIPMLKHKVGGTEATARTNSKKSSTLAKCFFPLKPPESASSQGQRYPAQCQGNIKITRTKSGCSCTS